MDTFIIKSGDLQPPYEPQLLDGGTPVDLSTAVEVRMRMRSSQGGPLVIDSPMTIVGSPVDGMLRYQWVDGDTDVVGKFYVEFVVTWPGGEQTFPIEDYCIVEVAPGLDATTSTLPALPDSCWPVDERVCAELDNLSVNVRETAKALAGETLRALTGYRMGGCPITVRPCSRSCCAASGGWYGVGSTFYPYIAASGEWVNACCESDDCDHLGTECIFLAGPVGEITEVLIDGDVVDPALYRVDNGNELVRLDGTGWPTTQDMVAATDQPDTFAVTYLRGIPVDGLGALAAGLLACEFAAGLNGQECKLPDNVTSITRQGVTMEIAAGLFPGGKTGIREVDAYLMRWNPTGLTAPMRVYSPDLAGDRRTTWS